MILVPFGLMEAKWLIYLVSPTWSISIISPMTQIRRMLSLYICWIRLFLDVSLLDTGPTMKATFMNPDIIETFKKVRKYLTCLPMPAKSSCFRGQFTCFWYRLV